MTGWECPKCGRCYAPWVNSCDHCNGEVWGGITATISTPPPTGGPGDTVPITITASDKLSGVLTRTMADALKKMQEQGIITVGGKSPR